MDGAEGVAIAREMNDVLAEAIARHPDRFQGFAHLPMREPEAAAEELVRSVKTLGFRGALINGMTNDRFLDDGRFEPILAAAQDLDVPIYLHPHLAPQVLRELYYSNLPGTAGYVLEAAGWGWHRKRPSHVLRLVLAGTLDRHPRLKLIIGHMGEGCRPCWRAAIRSRRPMSSTSSRPISRTILEQVWITTSGMFSQPPFLAALLTFGIDRILFSVDYPMLPMKAVVLFSTRWRWRRPIWPSSPTATPIVCSSSARVHASAAPRLNDRLARAGTAPRRTGHPRRVHYVSAPKS